MLPTLMQFKFTFRHPVVWFGGIAVIVAVAALVLTTFFYWYPEAKSNIKSKNDINNLRNKHILANSLNSLSHTYYASEKLLNKIEGKLVSSAGLAEFTNELHKLASRNNVKITISSSGIQEKESYKLLNQELTIKGRYSEMRKFILGLKDMPTWTLVKEVRFKKINSSDDLIGEFVLVSYQKWPAHDAT